jgi:hypothetical protein
MLLCRLYKKTAMTSALSLAKRYDDETFPPLHMQLIHVLKLAQQNVAALSLS